MKKMLVITGIVILVLLLAIVGYFFFSASSDEEGLFGVGYETLEKSSIPDTNPFDNANPFASESSSSEEKE